MMKMKKIYLIPRYAGNHHHHWYIWLKDEIEKSNKDVAVTIITPPNWQNPSIDETVKFLRNQIPVDSLNENVFLVGHSLGCQACLRYAENINKPGVKIGGMVLVAAWLKVQEPWKEIQQWCDHPINFEKIREVTTPGSVKILISDNDPFTPDYKTAKSEFEKMLKAEVKILTNRRHLTDNHIEEVKSELEKLVLEH
jgi:predicted alpha/beta hydrolase family esterase